MKSLLIEIEYLESATDEGDNHAAVDLNIFRFREIEIIIIIKELKSIIMYSKQCQTWLDYSRRKKPIQYYFKIHLYLLPHICQIV